ncbi:sensor histidine kinase [Clostridium lundense]|uniref:sensor histidine kinase n=1 Tax=Clostridium lundense TaxID=319475 RepID=UPI0004859A62|nr:sensor histidine kinase [Clostridium lundense]
MIRILVDILFTILMLPLLTLIGYYTAKLMECFVTLREGAFYKVITILGMSCIASVVIFISDIINISWTLIAYIALMLICYKENFIKKISVIFILYPIIISINLFFSELSIRGPLPDLKYKQILLIIKYILTASIWRFIYNLVKDKIIYAKEYITDKIWILIDIISLSSFTLAMSMVIFTSHARRYQAFIVMPACLISNLTILFTIKLVIQSVKIQADNNIFKLQSKYYETLEKEQKNIRKIRHDMNNHLQIIGTYLNNGNLEEGKKYLESLSCVVNDNTTKFFCTNDIINAVINNKYILIKENNIKNEISISIDEISKINNMDLCSIFANTFDNAIEACLKIKEPSQRYIAVKARYNKGYFIYNINNTKNNAVLTDNKRYFTDKNNKELHGWGLQNVTDIVNKYNGDIEISHTDNEFSVLIIIPLL